MLCQECKKRPATFHFTKIINGEKSEVHVCEKCAQDNSDMLMFHTNPGFSFHNLLSGLLNLEPSLSQQGQTLFQNSNVLQCERCKMTFSQFKQMGRFGCSHCYKTFEKQMTPILRRVHGGNTVHGGKIPQRIGGAIHLRKRIKQLKQQLQEVIASEEFEKAAEIRDEIRMLEAKLNGPDGEGV